MDAITNESSRAWRAACLPLIAACALLSACSTTPVAAPASLPNADLVRQVTEAERAFAQTMADRNFPAFVAFLSDEAVFFGGKGPLRGKAAVAAAWKPFYEQPKPPFSWTPGDVEVLAGGTLALSTGPVRNPAGKHVATFTSIWRQEAPGTWKIVFDKGNDVCDCANTPNKTP